MMRRFIFVSALIFMTPTHAVIAQTRLPANIAEPILKECQIKSIPPAAVKTLDLNGDGIADYIINFETAGCSGFCGSAGCFHEFWISDKQGLTKSMNFNLQAIERLEPTDSGFAVIVGMHGSTCGRSGFEVCRYRITWEGAKATRTLLTDPSAEKPISLEALLQSWHTLNTKCRGGSGDKPETHLACDQREKVSAQLERLGRCYGKKGQAGYQMEWHRCGRDSNRGNTLPQPMDLAAKALGEGAWVSVQNQFPGQDKKACAAFQKFGVAKLSGKSEGELVYFASDRRLDFGGYADTESKHLSVKINPDGSFAFRDRWYDDGEGGSRSGNKIKTYTVRKIDASRIEITEGKDRSQYALCRR